ncbi:TPA: tyrosine-type recombinase/integrase [Klebsiella michiganensis]|nr:tyrosine-type recombinase/integrase [Klebsiella michiganensis]
MFTNGTLSLKELPGVFQFTQKKELSCIFSDPEFRSKGLACGCPEYLLSTEIITLLHYLPDLSQQALIATLLNTGAKISEAICLTRNSFVLKSPYPYVQLMPVNTTSGGGKKITGPLSEKPSRYGRIIPLLNKNYVMQLKKFFFEHNQLHSSCENTPIWDIEGTMVVQWLNDAVCRAKKDGIRFEMNNITPIILRRSYAVYMLTLGIHPTILEKIICGNHVSDLPPTVDFL